mgnify:CR=1 FL=1
MGDDIKIYQSATIVEGKADTTAEKIANLEAIGISVAERIEDIPRLLSERIEVTQ